MRIGRNDPCHCGSGKKYKKCCLGADESLAAKERPAVPSVGQSEALPNHRQTVGRLRKLAALAPQAKTEELQRILDQAQPLLTYMERKEEIETASQTLEAHREEFEKLMDDERAYQDRAHKVFAEERFRPAWFTKDEVRRALEHVGYAASRMDDEQAVESLRAAILNLADEETRSRLSMILLASLPDYVTAGRMLDGWIVQHCAYCTVDLPDESNVFLFEIFSRGYDAWAAEKRAAESRFLQEFGLDTDRLTSMSMDELDALVAQQTAPEARARIEAVFKAHPDQKALSEATMERMERDAVAILEREDALPLMLSPDEVAPWLPRLLDGFQRAAQELPAGTASAPDAATAKAVGEAIWPVIREMAGAIFTGARLQELVTCLRAYRNERFEAGDKRIAGLAQTAITLVETEREPAENYFLNALCFNSIRAVSAAESEAAAR